MKKFGILSLAIIAGILLLFSREATATREKDSSQTGSRLGQDPISTVFQPVGVVDFETIPGAVPSEGLEISTQFLNTDGITFRLEGGGHPVLADVGGNQTAFGSSFGSDTPAPNQNIGAFFLTDDGVLAGLEAPALIIDYNPPTAAASGEILDIDFDEIFTIEARNASGTVIDTIVIEAGDPNTGDGIATFWAFDRNKDDIFSIRFEGKREASGFFGLGFDNLNVRSSFPSTVKCGTTIRSIANGDWNTPATWQPNRIPTENDIVWIQADHTITGPSQETDIQGLCNEGSLRSQQNRALRLVASGLISNTGQITGLDGSDSATTDQAGRQGSSLTLRGSPVYNEGTIQAGVGGEGPVQGGKGGSVKVIGRDVTNHGTMCAGRGGHVAGTGAGTAGQGGDTHIRGNRGGDGTLLNDGLLCAGDGGQGNNAATQPQDGGDGGCLKLVARPVLLSNGQHYAGVGGSGSGGGQAGLDGCVVIDPILIDLSGNETEVRGGQIRVAGGQDWILDLRSLKSVAISATQSITLSTGAGGAVDLRDNNMTVIQAAGPVLIATDVISIDVGVTLADLISAQGGVADEGSEIVFDTAVSGPGQVGVFPGGGTLSLPVTVFNNGPAADTYTLTVSDALGWSLSGLPSSVSVEALALADLTLDIDIPADAPLQTVNTVSVTVASQADPSQTSTTQIEVEVSLSEGEAIYLPLIVK